MDRKLLDYSIAERTDLRNQAIVFCSDKKVLENAIYNLKHSVLSDYITIENLSNLVYKIVYNTFDYDIIETYIKNLFDNYLFLENCFRLLYNMEEQTNG